MTRARSIMSHLVAAGIGVAIAATWFSTERYVGAGLPKKAGTVSGRGGDAESFRGRKDAKRQLSKNDYKIAWAAVPTRRLNRLDRITLQQEIIGKWAAVDLQGALDAVMKEAWDERGQNVGGTYYFPPPLLEAFSQAFSDRPLDAWELIQSGRYGVATELLRRQWVESVVKTDGFLVASMLSNLSENLRKEAITGIVRGAKTADERAAVVSRIIDLAGKDHGDWIQQAFNQLPGGDDPGELRKRWSSLPEGTTRRITMMEWGASLKKMKSANLSAELDQIPPDAREKASQVILSQLTSDYPGLLTVLDFAISAGQLEVVSKLSPAAIADFAERGLVKPEELVEWACNLPESPDTVEMFYKAVGRYIRDDLPRARQWLEAMPEGSWQRENGLAEFSQQALWRKNDPAASQWALDAITDPAVRANAEKWRMDWEKQNAPTQ
ncbi:hypothetical protein JIN84_20650 [Luteolibacter yonseiensis]|uniref:Uncharacterized protein n=1 Tax=Luteolibacter yonseiensis TaxID=1144680 RepID=A0A934VDD8_9BACT|nr:hypothetical protein [Luteolibacter yonseiensis]MBK1818045.1 hypothetical protein [Luteolibacter yonseiensis]